MLKIPAAPLQSCGAHALAREVGCRLKAVLEIVRETADLACKIRRNGLRPQVKGPLDIVTEADFQAEQLIRRELQARFPDDSVFGEEYPSPSDTANVWAVDPIDGTVNFAAGSHYWCISLAWVLEGRTEIGVIAAPDTGRIYTALRGVGAWCNDTPLMLDSGTPSLQPVVGLGISGRRPFDRYLEAIRRLQNAGIEHRRFGSGALMIAEVAAGVMHGYYEPHMNSWDALAGLLLVREAGGLTTDFLKNNGLARGNQVLAVRKEIAAKLLDILAVTDNNSDCSSELIGRADPPSAF